MMERKQRLRVWPAAQWIFLTAACLVIIVPVVLTFISSFKSNHDFFYNTYQLPKVWLFSNYVSAWTDASMGRFFFNSVVITTGSVALNLVVSAPLSYALARYHSHLNSLIYAIIVGGLIAPTQLIGLSLLQWVKTLHIFGTYLSLILPYAAFGMPVAVLVLTGFFRQLPRELDEAGFIDGANELQVFTRILVPLIRPAIATVVIFNGIGVWNDFFLPLVLAYTPNIQTLPLGILLLFGSYSTDWGKIFAAVLIASLPAVIAYFFLTRQFISGLSAGAVKG